MPMTDDHYQRILLREIDESLAKLRANFRRLDSDDEAEPAISDLEELAAACREG